MSALFHFGQMGNQAPEVVCYEKGNTLAWTLEFYLDDGYVHMIRYRITNRLILGDMISDSSM
jgi:hypothetical protein